MSTKHTLTQQELLDLRYYGQFIGQAVAYMVEEESKYGYMDSSMAMENIADDLGLSFVVVSRAREIQALHLGWSVTEVL